MEKGIKGIAAGITTGTAFATTPVLGGFTANLVNKNRIEKNKKAKGLLKAEQGKITDSENNPVGLWGINLNEVAFDCLSDGEILNEETADIFSRLEERFGHYGAREIYNCCYENAVTKKDIKALAKTGITCVTVPLRSFLLAEGFKKKKKQIHYKKLDNLISLCKKQGIYVILSLETAPGYQNNLSECGKSGEAKLFGKGKEGSANRTEFIKLWERIAKHYKNENGIAAYNLMAKPMTGTDKNIKALTALYTDAIKVIRKAGDKHIVALEAPSFENAEEIMAVKDENIAFAFSGKCGTVFELDSMLLQAKSVKEKGYAVMGINLYPSDYEKALTELNNSNIACTLGSFKGDMCCLYCGEKPVIDLVSDSHEEMKTKLKEGTNTKNYRLNKELAKILKAKKN